MSFHAPHLLWLLAPLVLLFSWELARHAVRTVAVWPKITRAWAGTFQVSLGTAHTTAENRPRIWLWFGLALCLVALARPQWGTVEEKVFDQSREVLIAVDLSRSMLTQDVKPSRLDRSKLLIESLLDGLKGERVGLVLFAGTSFLQSPLSADYEILREFLPALKPDYLPEGGSDYKVMLETSIEAFGTSTADRYLIILSDGESTEEGWREMADKLKTKGIRVIGLGVGTAMGGLIPDGSGGFVKDERGAVVMSRLNASTLQELAQTTGGAYADASSWIDLAALLKQTIEVGRKGEFTERSTARLLERFQWFLAPGLLLLLISFWTEFPIRPRERALPLTGRGTRSAERGPPTAAAASLAIALLWLSGFSFQVSGFSAEHGTDPLSAPLTATVARLSTKFPLGTKDYAELAETTITYGQRLQSSQQKPLEGVVRDALKSVDLGEKLDAQATDWPKLRKELEALLPKEEPPKPEDKKQDQQQQDQDKKEQENQDQKENSQSSQKDEQQKQQSPQNQPQDPSQSGQPQKPGQEKQTPPPQPSDTKEKPFGDMKDEQAQPQKPEAPKPPPPGGTRKVGGQQDKKIEPTDQQLVVPMQKLEQVRNQDSPAKLQQILQGKPQPKPKTKDW